MKALIITLVIIFLLFPQNVFSTIRLESDQGISISGTNSSPVQFNKKAFTWTDRVDITINAPDFNSDPYVIDELGLTPNDKVTISTSGNSLPYRLVETGSNTGIFSGYVILTGDPTQKGHTGVDGQGTNPSGIQSICNPICGPTDGFLPSTGNDGITVSFEYNRDQTITGSALIHWNVGSVKWLQSAYPIDSQGVLQIVDPDMNLNPKAVDKFETSVWSNSDSGGIKLTMIETDKNTGIFHGTVYFTSDTRSSENRLYAQEGDTVTAEYIDRTLPSPSAPSGELRIDSTALIGCCPAPIERAPANNAKILDSFGNTLDRITPSQQIQIFSEITNNENKEQPFAYILQIQDSNGITLSLSWITGSMTPNQILGLSQSWVPRSAGTYTAEIFVWQNLANPNALSTPLTLMIPVSG